MKLALKKESIFQGQQTSSNCKSTVLAITNIILVHVQILRDVIFTVSKITCHLQNQIHDILNGHSNKSSGRDNK